MELFLANMEICLFESEVNRRLGALHLRASDDLGILVGRLARARVRL